MIVYGDTNSTLAGALTAAKLHVPVAHVEAGLRSFNRRMPEEINRVLTDHVSTLLFCPTETAVRNLANEGITQGVHLVGDVMLDALLDAKERAKERSTILDRLGLREKQYLLATVHRPENTDDPARLRSIMAALTQLGETEPVIFPVHPRTRKALENIGFDLPSVVRRPSSVEGPVVPSSCSPVVPDPTSVLRPPSSGLHFVEPLGYLDMVSLSSSARVILTDSGGLQKEACWLGVPCVTLRDETEWIETVKRAWNVLAGANTDKILECVREARPPSGLSYMLGSPSATTGRIVRLILQGQTGTCRGASEHVAQPQSASAARTTGNPLFAFL